MLLAIDTSTSAIGVALHDGDRVVAEHGVLDARAHGELVAPGIVTVLRQAGLRPADVDAVVVGTGPGPFTGLRVGIVSARTFALALDLPVHGLCSLDALAHEARQAAVDGPRRLVVATDARRKEVYWAGYDLSGELPVREGEPAVCRPADLAPRLGGRPVVGRGPHLYPELGAVVPSSPRDVCAGWLADLAVRRLAAGEDLSDTTPRYLRRPDAVPSVAPVTVV
ncbi:tRNA (adenosine(37)-N6)-threonylcarbamoyltransferase complex dimerization subunit type 1 TsaB [Arsenicicoccus dermatophilus]|uniref:tRNA (adenosine(37)-N6)-threonylcarbamoyltransferase complex dimerization subunit type 1 TsaB n=1 Tax=Arsenicicoccus dermatophilus TaxID=1076331 RepID=UPI0039173CAF